MEKIKVYLIGRIAEEYHERHESLSDMLDSRFEVFIPHRHNPFNTSHKKLQPEVTELDCRAIDSSDVALVSPPFGEDCSYEVGRCDGKSIPVVLFAGEDPNSYKERDNWLNNWMVKGGVKAVVTPNEQIEDIVRADPILRHKEIILTDSPANFSDFVYYIAKTYRTDKK